MALQSLCKGRSHAHFHCSQSTITILQTPKDKTHKKWAKSAQWRATSCNTSGLRSLFLIAASRLALLHHFFVCWCCSVAMFPCIMHDSIPLTAPRKCGSSSLICATRLFLILASLRLSPTIPLSPSHLQQGVEGWQVEISWQTSFSADKCLAPAEEKHIHTFLFQTNYSFYCSSFLTPSRCGDKSSCTCHCCCSYLPGPRGPYRVNSIISTHITTCVSPNGATQDSASDRCAPHHILWPQAAVWELKGFGSHLMKSTWSPL